MLRRLVVFFVLAYVLACGYMYAAQDDFLFFPKPLHADHAAKMKELQVRAPRPGALLHGWHLNPGQRDLLIYYGGNAEEVSHLGDDFMRREDWSTLLLNYRGYGLSTGEPSESALTGDALWVFDNLAHLLGYQPRRVVLVGRSLGTGVAMHVAARRSVQGVVLVTPYDSIRELSSAHYPWLPVSLLLQHPFDSVALAPAVNAPVHFLLAEEDHVVPHPHAERLAAAFAERPSIQTISGTTHNDVVDPPAFDLALSAILRKLSIQ